MMQQNPKSTNRIPQFKSIQETAEFWDTHSGEEFADEFEDIEVEIASTRLKRALRLTLDDKTMDMLKGIARKRKANPIDLVREWVSEKLSSESIQGENKGGMVLKSTERIAKNAIEILIARHEAGAAKLLLQYPLSFRDGFLWDEYNGEPPTLISAFLEVDTHEIAAAEAAVNTHKREIAWALASTIEALGRQSITDYEYTRYRDKLLDIRIRIIPSDVYEGWRIAYWGQLPHNT
ncbi:MAG: hypothetical protein JW395_2890 [Nitrospira sp.]|nr:hypothetical protein [Nitrospira sp.]